MCPFACRAEADAITWRRIDALVKPRLILSSAIHMSAIRVHTLVRRLGRVDAKLMSADAFTTPIALKGILPRCLLARLCADARWLLAVHRRLAPVWRGGKRCPMCWLIAVEA